jgi:hypothetical protein
MLPIQHAGKEHSALMLPNGLLDSGALLPLDDTESIEIKSAIEMDDTEAYADLLAGNKNQTVLLKRNSKSLAGSGLLK